MLFLSYALKAQPTVFFSYFCSQVQAWFAVRCVLYMFKSHIIPLLLLAFSRNKSTKRCYFLVFCFQTKSKHKLSWNPKFLNNYIGYPTSIFLIYVPHLVCQSRSHIIALRIPSLLSRFAVPAHMGIAKLTALGTNSGKAIKKLPVWKPSQDFYSLSWSRFNTMQLKATGSTSKSEFSPASLQNCTLYLCDCCSSGFHISLFRAFYQSSIVRVTLCNSTIGHTLAVCE